MTGVVVDVIVPPKGTRKQTSLRVDWTFGLEKKRKEVKICNIQLADEEPRLSSNNEMPENEDEGTENVVTEECSTQMEAVGKSTVSVPNSQSNTDVVLPHNTKLMEKDIRIPLNSRTPTKIWSVKNVNR